jgi:hypothetical protein
MHGHMNVKFKNSFALAGMKEERERERERKEVT